jgi:hypothetical protein
VQTPAPGESSRTPEPPPAPERDPQPE